VKQCLGNLKALKTGENKKSKTLTLKRVEVLYQIKINEYYKLHDILMIKYLFRLNINQFK